MCDVGFPVSVFLDISCIFLPFPPISTHLPSTPPPPQFSLEVVAKPIASPFWSLQVATHFPTTTHNPQACLCKT